MSESLHEACGVFGIFLPGEDVAQQIFTGLFALQHRGQESAGIATSNGEQLRVKKGMGLVTQVFDQESLDNLRGFLGIGHNRYSTTGGSEVANAQPIWIRDGLRGGLALAHNGNLVNGSELRQELEAVGLEFKSRTDSEAIALLLAHTPAVGPEDLYRQVMSRLIGAYSLTILTQKEVWAVRDPLGNRPLCLGRLEKGWVVASESSALNLLHATFIRDVEPGEVLRIDQDGLTSFFPLGKADRQAACAFERIYFADQSSRLNGETVRVTRKRLGEVLAIEHPCPGADLVIGVPDSATPAAIGYARQAGKPYDEGLVRNRFTGRTFMEPYALLRAGAVDRKLSAVPEELENLSIVVVDDSIVRGTTTPQVVRKLRAAGAREIHLRITSPPITDPCFYGVDMATREELIARSLTVEEIRQFTGADSLGFLSVEGLLKALQTTSDRACLACFTGQYPTPVQQQLILDMVDGSKTPSSSRDLVIA